MAHPYNQQSCLSLSLLNQMSKVILEKPARGPKVVFNKVDIREGIDKFGLEEYIKRVSAEQFNPNYIRKMFRIILENE